VHHICGLKYPNYVVNKNKVEIKTPYILLDLNGQASSNNFNPPRVQDIGKHNMMLQVKKQCSVIII
jgi:hypothetical protein